MRNKWRIYFLVLIILIFLIRIFIAIKTGLGDCESYYWEWSRHLDLSYYDHPPMVAYIIFIFTKIFGDTEFGVRIGGIIFSLLMTFFIYLLASNIFSDEKYGFFSALFLNIIPIYSVGSIIITPDNPLGFFWVLTLYLFYKFIDTKKDYFWYIIGFSIGFALLSKYFAVLLIPSIFLYLLLSKDERKFIFRKELYFTLFIAFIIFVPVIIWNANHNFASFNYHLLKRHKEAKITLEGLVFYLGGQALYLSPFIFLYFIFALFSTGFKASKDKRFLFLFSTSFPTFIFFSYASIWSYQEAEPHWTAMSYLPLIVALPYFLFNSNKKIIYIFILLVSFVLNFLLHIQSVYPLIDLKNPRLDITNELYGWKRAGDKINKIAKEMEKENKKIFLFSYHYVISPQIAFYTDKKYKTYCISKETDQYDFWDDPKKLIGWNAIFVGDNRYTDPPESRFLFEDVKKETPLKIYRGKRFAREFFIYRCYNYKGEK